MVILDTCALIFDALAPQKLSLNATKAIQQNEKNTNLYCSDISLWEIAMLVQKKRLDPGVDINTFLQLLLKARKIQVLAIAPEIAALSVTLPILNYHDPADRIIVATTLHYRAQLVTCDKNLLQVNDLPTIW